jgi:hypothetical protein
MPKDEDPEQHHASEQNRAKHAKFNTRRYRLADSGTRGFKTLSQRSTQFPNNKNKSEEPENAPKHPSRVRVYDFIPSGTAHEAEHW